MDPPLRERLRWRKASEEAVEAPATRAMMARTGALLAGAGAFICLGHSESMARITDRFELVRLDGAIVYRKP